MADNHRRATVALEFDNGERYDIRLGYNAMAEAESAVLKPDGSVTPFAELINSNAITAMRAILWAGLRGAGTNITLAETGELLAHIDHDELYLKLMRASLYANPRTTDDDINFLEARLREMQTALRGAFGTGAPPPATPSASPD